MSNGTLSTQHELLSGLADNNAKLITAADVSNIVKSNYQPVMIWSGIFTIIQIFSNRALPAWALKMLIKYGGSQTEEP